MSCLIHLKKGMLSYVKVKRKNKELVVLNSEVKPNDMILSYGNKPTYTKVIDVFDSKIMTTRRRVIKLTNGTKLHCSDNHAIMTMEDDLLVDVFPDELTPDHKVVTTSGLSNVEFVTFDNYCGGKFVDIITYNSNYFISNNKQDFILCYN